MRVKRCEPEIECAFHELWAEGVAHLALVYAAFSEVEALGGVSVLSPHAIKRFMRVRTVADVAGEHFERRPEGLQTELSVCQNLQYLVLVKQELVVLVYLL
jgi:hypothetical protein